MKTNKYIPTLTILLMVLVLFSCQDIDRPSLGDYPTDGPIIAVSYPNPSGTTLVRSLDATTSFNAIFKVTDDIMLNSVVVKLDGNQVASFTDFSDPKLFEEAGLAVDNVDTGSHTLTISATDSNDNTTTTDVPFEKIDAPPYNAIYPSEVFYMAFDGDYKDQVSLTSAEVIGTPSFAMPGTLTGDNSEAYKGAANSYLSIPLSQVVSEGQKAFTAAFWYRMDPATGRAGLLTVSPPDPNNPDNPNKRTNGFRFFREGGATQTFKLNVGRGDGENWYDGGSAAQLPADSGEWNHFAFTIAPDQCTVYINGEIVSSGAFSGVNWSDCTQLSIMSGEPNFVGWGHRAATGAMDELRFFSEALTQEQIQNIMEITKN